MRALAIITVLALFLSIAFAAHPMQAPPRLSSASGNNTNSENLVCYNQSTSDADGDPVTNIYNWFKNGESRYWLYLPFETNSTTVAKDYSGNARNGTVSAATWNASGKVGGAYSFNGASSVIEGPALPDSDAFTISVWVKPSSLASNSWILFDGDDTAGLDTQLMLITDGSIHYYTSNVNPGLVTSAGAIVTGEWTHIIAMNSPSGRWIYVNGTLAASESGYFVINRWRMIEIGRIYDGVNPAGGYYAGVMDEIHMFNRTLSSTEIQALYNREYNKTYSNDITVGDKVQCEITPNDHSPTSDGETQQSNGVTINWDGNLLAMLNISHTCSCGTNVSTTGISFGSLTAGQISTIQSLNFTNLGSGPTTDTTIEGTTWNASLTQGFGENYTKWSTNNAFNYADGTSVTTGPGTLSFNLENNESKQLYFRVQVPLGTTRGAYNQTLTLTTIC